MKEKELDKDGFIARRLKKYHMELPNNICPLTRRFVGAIILTVLWPLWFPGYYLMILFNINFKINPSLVNLHYRYSSGSNITDVWDRQIKEARRFDAVDWVFSLLIGLVFTISSISLYINFNLYEFNEEVVLFSALLWIVCLLSALLGLILYLRRSSYFIKSETMVDYMNLTDGKRPSEFKKSSELYFSPAVEVWRFIKHRYRDFKDKTCTPIKWT